MKLAESEPLRHLKSLKSLSLGSLSNFDILEKSRNLHRSVTRLHLSEISHKRIGFTVSKFENLKHLSFTEFTLSWVVSSI